MLHPHKGDVFLEVLVENKTFYFSSREPCAGTACNKWLKKAMAVELINGTFLFLTHKCRSKKERN